MHRAFARVLATSLCLAFGVGMGVVFTPAPCAAAPPTITVPGPQTVNEGALLTFSVSATDPDGQPIFFRASGVPTGATFRDNHNNTGTFTWTPTMFQAGSYLPAFTADDTFGGRDTKSVQIDVLNVNNAPVLDPIGDRSIERGTQAGINVTGDDPDGDNLSYTQVGLPSYGTFSDNGNGTASMWLAPPANEPTGSTSMTVTVSDGSLTASETFSITVFALQSANPPVLAPIGNQTVAEGAVATVGLSASDADLDVMTWTVSVPGFASVSPTGSGPGVVSADLTLTPSYCASGSYPANVAVSDGFNSDNESFTINVTDVNRTPSWTVPTGGYALALDEGGAADLSVYASDPDQECGTAAPVLLLLSSGIPPSLTVTLTDQGGGTGLLHVVASNGAAGSLTLSLRARDALDPARSVDVSVQVTVNAVNRAPVASAGGPYSGLVGLPVAMSASGSSDPDGDVLTLSWTFGDGSEGAGVAVSHAYSEVGRYHVSLTASDGSLASTDTTSAEVSTFFQARAFTDGSIKLQTGKPREAFYLEPVAGSFDIGSVDLSSLKLTAPAGCGTVDFIRPLPDRTSLGTDRDRNSVGEVHMEFAKEDLRALFSCLVDRSSLNMVLSADLSGGGSVQATVNADIWPERGKVVRRVAPNPMNPETVISLITSEVGYLRVRVYDLNGRLVRTVLDESNYPAGDHDIHFDGRASNGQPLSSGRYFLRVETPSAQDSGSLTILK
ncbi:MAG: PKD domain-containing protein [Candidatus Eisenbacteria bacterium]|uniref:PKD domain-containing protein n=1 Tax=Eiseniibacteriota bacterium TaxID=2212470 RepID=A0A538SV64_UNCEI|nr:MAG: PKD domain-containing protein [Candidatus Eisenbacteria bacterium]